MSLKPDQRRRWPCDLALALNPRGRIIRCSGDALVLLNLCAKYRAIIAALPVALLALVQLGWGLPF